MTRFRLATWLPGIVSVTLAAGVVVTTSCGGDDSSGGAAGTGGSAGTTGFGGSAGTSGAANEAGTGGGAGVGGDDASLGDAASGTLTQYDDITADTTWTANNVYVIPRMKQLFIKNGATLTIEAGTVVQGNQGSVLVITRGSKIRAEGTKERPILLTTTQADGAKTPGFWGGLLVLGNAPINASKLSTPPSDEATFEAFTASLAEGKFGGTDPHDSSGVIKYVRIEFAGFNFVADREFNNLTLCGVGDGTLVDYVQVHHGKDDGIEFFGGTVNVKHILSSQNEDDGFDTDNGWEGKAQFVIVQNIHPDGVVEASNGYESDNHAVEASYEATPRTLPTVYNVTLLGKKDAVGTSYAAVLRRGTGGRYYNHIFMNFPGVVDVRDMATASQVAAGNLFFKNSIFFHNGDGDINFRSLDTTPGTVDVLDEAVTFRNPDWQNREVDPGLPAEAFSATAPNFKPADGAAALTGAATPPDDGFFDPTATFLGAIGTDDWTQGWTAYPQTP